MTYVIKDGAGTVIDAAQTQTEAFRLVDWFSRREPEFGPYRCVPDAEVA